MQTTLAFITYCDMAELWRIFRHALMPKSTVQISYTKTSVKPIHQNARVLFRPNVENYRHLGGIRIFSDFGSSRSSFECYQLESSAVRCYKWVLSYYNLYYVAKAWLEFFKSKFLLSFNRSIKLKKDFDHKCISTCTFNRILF